jgi:uncharacterized damage-inducible protein DinB
MAEDRRALLEHFRAMRAALLAAIEGLSDEQQTDPSLDGWSVKDHLAHVALWDDLRAAEVERISAGHATTLRMNAEQEEAFNRVAYELRRDLSLEQVRWEVATSRRRLVVAIEAATPRGLDPSLYGEAGLRTTHEAAHAGWIARWRKDNGI